MNCSTPGLSVHHQLPEFTQTHNPLSHWCHPAISSFVIPFSSCPQSLPASGSFPMSQLFAWGGQSIGVSTSASVLPMNTQDWSPLGWTGWISLQSKGLSIPQSSPIPQFKSINSLALSFLHSPTLTSLHDTGKTIYFYMLTTVCHSLSILGKCSYITENRFCIIKNQFTLKFCIMIPLHM